MIGRRTTLIVIVVTLALTLGSCTPLPKDYGPQPSVKWRVHIGSSPNTRISAAVAVADGMVFVPAFERQEGLQPFGQIAYVQGLDVRDGRFLWHSQVEGYEVGRPIATGSKVYFASWQGRLYATNASDGQVKWSVPVWDETGMPVLDGNEIFIASSDSASSPGPGSIVALDAATGVDRWQVHPRFPLPMAPAVARETVFIADGDGLLALDRGTGRERWRFPIQDGARTGVMVDMGIAYVAGADTLYAIDAQTGEERWHYQPQAVRGQIRGLTFKANTAYLVLNESRPEDRPAGTLIAVDLGQRREVWRAQERVWFNPQPVWVTGRLCVTAQEHLFLVDAVTGQLVSRTRIGRMLQDPVLADGVVYIGDGDGYLTALVLPEPGPR